MEWHHQAKNIAGHKHDPFHPGGCPGCREREHFEISVNKQQMEMKTQFDCDQMLSTLKQYKTAMKYFNENNFKTAKDYFRRALFALLKDIHRNRKTRHVSINNQQKSIFKQMYITYMNRCICVILLFCYECNNELNRYEYCMRDLNYIISICKPLIEKEPSHQYCVPLHLKPTLIKVIIQRAKLFQAMGNSAHALFDYIFLESLGCNVYSNNSAKLSSLTHPNPQLMVENNINTKQMVKFAVNGWNKINPMQHPHALPTKYGHTMFEYNNKLYAFGGKNYYETKGKYHYYHFLEIDLNLHTNKYTFKNILFPNKYIQILFDMKDTKNIDQALDFAKSLRIVKWKHFMIVFGGNNYPFVNLVRYDLKHKRWENAQFGGDSVPKELMGIKQIFCHSVVVIDDKLYCFGGCPQSNRLCCFDFQVYKWKILSAHIVNPRTKGFNNIPEERFDHFMFVDEIEKCIYIGFGHYHRFDAKYILTDPQRHDIWKFDISVEKWSRNDILNGNVPLARAESGYCMGKNNCFYLFGGYSTGILRKNACELSLYAYLSDFFEFNLKSKKWKIIQSKVYPSHRAKAGICYYKDYIVLYGGYCSSNITKCSSINNDLWVININEMESISNDQSVKYCKHCRKNSAQMRLWKCKGSCSNTQNVATYCSFICQKRDWKYYHRNHCYRL
eukprot:551932_1